jgi:hypothetical protein
VPFRADSAGNGLRFRYLGGEFTMPDFDAEIPSES